nr:MAG TPA: hypothetical protein [Caudoviricetes sp.]
MAVVSVFLGRFVFRAQVFSFPNFAIFRFPDYMCTQLYTHVYTTVYTRVHKCALSIFSVGLACRSVSWG